ncbi:MAG: acetylornithine transaminase [Gammaproteobacteria bacterium]|nr:acetylornithine transaminase [Gammaproteobacteria bacterium]
MTLAQYDTSALMNITARPDIVFTSGSGSWLVDDSGRRYLDFVQGWAVNCLGHAPPVIASALAAQAARLITPSPAFYNDKALQLAQAITDSSAMDQVFFANSGAEANEGAIKLARKYGRANRNGAFEIITFVNGFHGRTLATMSASGKPGWDTMFAPQVAGFPKAELNNIESVKALVSERTVAIMLEPVQGEAGVLPATAEFLNALRELCDAQGLLLIFDEVQTGIGRLGHLYGYQHYGVVPDIMTLGKGLGGGVPLAALTALDRACVFAHGEQGGTFNGNPLMCAAGLAVMETVSDPVFLAEVRATADYLVERLTALSAELGLGSVRGIGMLQAMELGADIGSRVVELARDDGLLLNSPRPASLRFMPALNVTRDEIDQMLDMLRSVVDKAR